MNIKISGTYAGKPVDLEIETDADGRAWADFMFNAYERALERAPSFMDRVMVNLPTIARAMKQLHDFARKL